MADEFRAWLEANHDTATELEVVFFKKGRGKPSMSWSESVDQALCFGWIDGVRRGRDDESYTIRFTPRKPRSTWSNVNVAKVAELKKRGLMRPAGLAAFDRRSADNTGVYSFERDTKLDPEYEARLRANKAAAEYFDSRPPWYRRTAVHLVMSAKRVETRVRRLERLIDDSAAGRDLKELRR
ncbi:MAG: hypothetical protein QOE69_326 [Thermoleophilaceae bacterium]|jgi:uncharacterized protein YdeI (YjbR/CyaY-like superfamily)|nr:hypothetical protein [Thermoleophilaceae bacterium]